MLAHNSKTPSFFPQISRLFICPKLQPSAILHSCSTPKKTKGVKSTDGRRSWCSSFFRANPPCPKIKKSSFWVGCFPKRGMWKAGAFLYSSFCAKSGCVEPPFCSQQGRMENILLEVRLSLVHSPPQVCIFSFGKFTASRNILARKILQVYISEKNIKMRKHCAKKDFPRKKYFLAYFLFDNFFFPLALNW